MGHSAGCSEGDQCNPDETLHGEENDACSMSDGATTLFARILEEDLDKIRASLTRAKDAHEKIASKHACEDTDD